MTKLEKFIILGKELGFNNVDIYAPKDKLTVITFSRSKKYINKISKIEETQTTSQQITEIWEQGLGNINWKETKNKFKKGIKTLKRVLK